MSDEERSPRLGWLGPPWRRALAALMVVITVVGMAGLPVYVFPQIDPLRRADAIFVVGGFGYLRNRLGLQLGEAGLAPTVLISNPNGTGDQFLSSRCAEPQSNFRLVCFVPDPPTTKGEGRELSRLAEKYGWETVIVVTSRPHISRARFILSQCFDGSLVMIDSPSHIPLLRWPYEYAYQTLGYLRAVLEPGC